MVKRNNIIEVNGKRYDASTGKLLAGAAATAPKHSAPAGLVDGITRPHRAASAPAASPARTHKPAHRPAQKSRTLMRQAVKKPSPTHKKAILGHPKNNEPAKSILPAHTQDRVQRAAAVPKSKLISRFGGHVPSSAKPKIDVLPVRQSPVAVQPEPSILSTTLQHATSPFQHAIDRATSHTEPKPKKTKAHHKLAHRIGVKPKLISIGTSALAFVLIAGFIAYQNVPNVTMRVATAKAGVRGTLPGYQPSGFSMQGPIKFSPGQIMISYKSNSDDRNFDVVQKASEWNSDTLLKNHVAVGSRPYQIFHDKDKTIYLYEGSNATWVEQGIWYEIKGSSALSSDQLLRMAKSF